MNGKNEFEKEHEDIYPKQNNKANEDYPHQGASENAHLSSRDNHLQEQAVEGQPHSRSTQEKAHFDRGEESNSVGRSLYYAQDERKTTNADIIPPVPPSRKGTSIGGGGGEPPKNIKGFLGYFLTGLIGVLVGGLIVFLATSNLNNTDGSIVGSKEDTNTSPTKTENVTYKNSTDITKAVKKTQEAVVSVLNYQPSNSLEDEFGGNYNSGPSNSQKEASSGSGVIYKKANGKAYVVTNNHVVKDASKLEVTFSNGKKSSAKKIGSDPWNDLAVLEISDKNVTKVAELGNSDALTVGERSIAIGSPLGKQLAGSVTQGVISGVNRTVPTDINQDGKTDWEAEVIQTDAAINPGNSGGALINIEGQVIGINSMKISTPNANVEGIGFAIPINTAKPIIEQLEKKGEVTRPSVGVTLRDVATITESQQQSILKLPKNVNYGAMIEDITSGSPAAKAGLKQYDIIVEVGGKKVTNIVSFRRILYNNNLKMGEKIKVKFYRDGKMQTVDLTLEPAKNSIQ